MIFLYFVLLNVCIVLVHSVGSYDCFLSVVCIVMLSVQRRDFVIINFMEYRAIKVISSNSLGMCSNS